MAINMINSFQEATTSYGEFGDSTNQNVESGPRVLEAAVEHTIAITNVTNKIKMPLNKVRARM